MEGSRHLGRWQTRLPPCRTPAVPVQAEQEAEGFSGGVAWRRTGEDDGRIVGAAPGPCQCADRLASVPFAVRPSSSVRGVDLCSSSHLRVLTRCVSNVLPVEEGETKGKCSRPQGMQSTVPVYSRCCYCCCWCLLHSGPSGGPWHSEHLKLKLSRPC